MLNLILQIWDDEIISLPDSDVWDLVSLIYSDWINMERKNWEKPLVNHLAGDPQQVSEWVGQDSEDNSDTKVKYSIVKENKEKVNVNEQSLSLNSLWDNDFRDAVLEHIRNKQTNQRTVTEDMMLQFSSFDYEYSKKETFYTLRDWIIELCRNTWKNGEEMRLIIFNWHTYWTGQPKNKQPKDCKASLCKNPMLTKK